MKYINDPESIVKIAIDKFTDVSGMFEPWSRIGKGMIDKTFDAILNKIKSVFSVLIPKVDYKARYSGCRIKHICRPDYETDWKRRLILGGFNTWQ